MSNTKEQGTLSINSENIFPVIKKWLYSDSDIFIRELVSNACDAIAKLKKLIFLGETNKIDNDFKVDVFLNTKEKLITFTDNGIGMTADEIKKYINQIAFSGATEFLDKFKDSENDIIGHFGLGFYSAFMVSDKVVIDTLSYKEDAKAMTWSCNGGTEFELSESTKSTRGTVITLHISEEAKDFLEPYRIKNILKKYCEFMPINIYFNDDSTDSKNAEPINDSNPLWLKEPKDCTKEDYNKFYTKVFNDFNEPLFFIHLNMDYPFKLKGILYFPKLNHELESIEGQVKLYNNQVYVADNIKEVIPEFLLLLKGVLDCPDLPLNVSRSFLQNDGYVNKMSKYISKKVADKLNSIFKNNRKEYNNYWESISIFIKYGAMKEKDFYDRIKKSILFKSIYGELHTLDEFLELTKEKTETKIYYVSDERQQAQYIKLFKDNELDAVLLPHKIDNTFISHIEFYESDKKLQFARIDSEVSNLLKSDDTDIDSQKLIKAFEEALDLPNIKIKSESMKSTDISAIILIDEQSRRMEEMSKLWNNMHIPGMDKSSDNKTLIINAKSDLVHSLMPHIQEDNKDMIKLVCKHIYDLAMLSQNRLDTDGMNSFILRNNLLLQKIIEQSASS